VRLHQGDFAAETVYDDDPVSVARAFARAGAQWIHVVDLDAARTGEPANLAVIEAIGAAVSCPLQVGGGVRSVAAAGDLMLAGASRVVVGTAAVEQPALVEEIATLHPGSVAVGLDARGGEVAVRGWTEGTGVDLVDLVTRFTDAGVAALVVTEIDRDGTMAGPSLEQLRAVLAATPVPVIASGGVGSLGDLDALAGLAGTIVGKALYEGRFTLAEALAALG
jgi:phosphoribosylformimino-5-aminoimidazole carboxamide ribotide isomerase